MKAWAPFAGCTIIILFPWMPGVSDSLVGALNIGAAYALVGMSLVLLTGWTGLISLGHAALVGVGGYLTGTASVSLGLGFPFSVVAAAAAAAALGVLLGASVLRVRGLYLAVVTLVFSWMASEFLFRQSWFVTNDQIGPDALGRAVALPRFDLADRRIFFMFAWSIVAVVAFLFSNLRRSRTGRGFFAIRGSEMAAASLGIPVARFKLLAFGLSGAAAGLAGGLLMTDARVVTPDQFTFNRSLFFLAIAVIGGLRSLGGSIASAILFAGITEVFFRYPFLARSIELISSLLLAVTLIVDPEGLAGFVKRFRKEDPDEPAAATTDAELPPLRRQPAPGVPLLEATGVTVRFGGLTAVDDASLRVLDGEIVGLIGPNGAGKTTFFNAIAGYVVPTEGRIEAFGQDVTTAPIHARAQLGIARTFQHIQLFAGMTVRENLAVATHMHHGTGPLQHALNTRRWAADEAAVAEAVAEAIDVFRLSEVADRDVSGLPFGVLRMVEIARAAVTGFPLIMLDEPASGLDERETDSLIAALYRLRDSGRSMLLIEHDVRMVSQVCDQMTVLERGKPIASGEPSKVLKDPLVVAAYLGEPHEAEVQPA
jgi:branched-chain amino acid transport system permease protein